MKRHTLPGLATLRCLYCLLMVEPTELSEMLLSVMLDVRAWALARPLVEHENARVELSDKLREIEKIQEEQGRFSFFGTINESYAQ